ncbi:uncharacterized protein LAESUDRAFT_757220 [Laetiporus sulphureus 93-53]|uniref:Uncharacterized protein n=1 Tax=Laetiporus sulphureus 93-53 TaxID=1314785 RepID=A0A165FJ68_9APHY|nr:uncharacterized protein LAESUDRAFT_757220 [Laetiporus sulphureus 93-53]KZT09052.1 hypothetical protein LAESUDRAFT_757220 [Laetiporus sulphureus 93-53]
MSPVPSPSSSSSTQPIPRDDSPIAIGQHVRFDADCVLIPDPSPVSRMPRLVTKSYSVPLWRKRGQDPSSVSDSELDREDEHVVLKVSVPSIAIKSRSPSRSEAAQQPLVPCIVYHDHDCHPVCARGHRRQASLPSTPRLDVVTVPLRPCCPNCYHITEECLREGSAWEEKFTRGARRLRASSADARPAHSSQTLFDTIPGFDSIIAVDEVDKRRRARVNEKSLSTSIPEFDLHSDDEELLLPSLAHRAATMRRALGKSRRSARLDHTAELKLAATRAQASTVFSPVTPPDSPLYGEGHHALHLEMGESPPLDLPLHDPREDQKLPPPPPPILPSYSNCTNGSMPNLLSNTLPRSRSSTPSVSPIPGAIFPHFSSISTPVHMHLLGRPSLDHMHTGSVGRRRPHLHLPGPGSFFKVSAEILKGVSMSGGAPLSV